MSWSEAQIGRGHGLQVLSSAGLEITDITKDLGGKNSNLKGIGVGALNYDSKGQTLQWTGSEWAFLLPAPRPIKLSKRI